MRCLLLACALAASTSAGCGEHVVYEIRLEPNDDGLRRTLTVWREERSDSDEPNKPLPDADLKNLLNLYAERLTADGDIRQTFRGRFRREMPADVGGRGTYDVSRSPLGTSYTYLERFRGRTDVDVILYDRRAAIDRLCDLTVAWFEKQMVGRPEQAAVRRFLNQEFRDDVRNVSALLFLALDEPRPAIDEDDEKPNQFFRHMPGMLRVVDYLAEHDYLQANELHTLPRLLSDEGPEAWTLLRRMLARKAGLDEAQADRTLACLDNSDGMRESWRELLRGTPEFARKRREAQAAAARDPEAVEPEPLTVLEDLLSSGLFHGGVIFAKSDDLRLTLALDFEPADTNGDWDPEARVVRWRAEVSKEGHYPTMCFAKWCVADEKFQLAHFGRIAIEGEALVEFAELHRLLSPMQQAEIDKHLRSLEPGDAIKGRAQDFRFVGEADPLAQSIAKRMIEIVAGSL